MAVEPSPLESALAFFEEEVEARKHGDSVERPAPLGLLERREPSGRWSQVWARALVNAIAPVELLVSDNGFVVTFDNWHSVGYGKDVIVIYEPTGRLVREIALTDLVSQDYIDSLPHSVSSLSWRKGASVDAYGNELVVEVLVPSDQRDATKSIPFRIGLRDGRILGPDPAALRWAIAESDRVLALRKEKAEARLAYLRAPLVAPEDCDVAAWHTYLSEAHMRLTPHWLDVPTVATKVLFGREDPRFEKSLGWLIEAISDEARSPGEVAIASPCHELDLEPALRKAFKKIGGKSLSQSILYISASPETRAVLEPIVTPSDAAVHWLDPASTVSQRPERIPGSPEEAAANAERERRQEQMFEELFAEM